MKLLEPKEWIKLHTADMVQNTTPCPNCKDKLEVECDECSGSGCAECSGTGKIECPDCNGLGSSKYFLDGVGSLDMVGLWYEFRNVDLKKIENFSQYWGLKEVTV